MLSLPAAALGRLPVSPRERLTSALRRACRLSSSAVTSIVTRHEDDLLVPVIPWRPPLLRGEGSVGCRGCSQLGTAQVPGIKPTTRLSRSVSRGWRINSFPLMCFLSFLQGLASCFGICAINHLEETLAKLEDFVRSDVFKKSVGLFSIFKVRAKGPPRAPLPPSRRRQEAFARASSAPAYAGALLGKGGNTLRLSRGALGVGGRLGVSSQLPAARRLPSQGSRWLAGWAPGSSNSASASVGGPRPDVERGLALAHLGAVPERLPQPPQESPRRVFRSPSDWQRKLFLRFSAPGGRFGSRSLETGAPEPGSWLGRGGALVPFPGAVGRGR